MQIVPLSPDMAPALQQFLARHYPDCPAKADPAYRTWKFSAHPAGSALSDYLLAIDEGVIIGQLALIKDYVWIAGSVTPCYWLADLIVAESHRTTAALFQLLRTAMANHPLLMLNGATEKLAPLFHRFGWKPLTVMTDFYQILRPSGALRFGRGVGRMGRLRHFMPLVAIADGILPLAWSLVTQAQTAFGRYDVRPLDPLDREIGTLFAAIVPKLGATSARDASIYQWKTHQRPIGTDITLGAYDAVSGILRGCLVAKIMDRVGVARWIEISDLLVDPDDHGCLIALLTSVRRMALDTRADFLRARLGWPALAGTLARQGWLARPSTFSNQVLAYSRDNDHLQALTELPWTLTAMIGDTVDTGRDEWRVGQTTRLAPISG